MLLSIHNIVRMMVLISHNIVRMMVLISHNIVRMMVLISHNIVRMMVLKGPERQFLLQRNVENRPIYESLVHNMTFKSNKMLLP